VTIHRIEIELEFDRIVKASGGQIVGEIVGKSPGSIMQIIFSTTQDNRRTEVPEKRARPMLFPRGEVTALVHFVE
jgi:hypothetical protein